MEKNQLETILEPSLAFVVQRARFATSQITSEETPSLNPYNMRGLAHLQTRPDVSSPRGHSQAFGVL